MNEVPVREVKMSGEMAESDAAALKGKAIRGAGVNIAAQSVAIAFQTVGAVVLARLLGPADFGLVAMVTAVSTWIANFGVNGFTEYIIFRQDLDEDEVVAVYWLHVLGASALTAGWCFGFGLVVDSIISPAGGSRRRWRRLRPATRLSSAPIALLEGGEVRRSPWRN